MVLILFVPRSVSCTSHSFYSSALIKMAPIVKRQYYYCNRNNSFLSNRNGKKYCYLHRTGDFIYLYCTLMKIAERCFSIEYDILWKMSYSSRIFYIITNAIIWEIPDNSTVCEAVKNSLNVLKVRKVLKLHKLSIVTLIDQFAPVCHIIKWYTQKIQLALISIWASKILDQLSEISAISFVSKTPKVPFITQKNKVWKVNSGVNIFLFQYTCVHSNFQKNGLNALQKNCYNGLPTFHGGQASN